MSAMLPAGSYTAKPEEILQIKRDVMMNRSKPMAERFTAYMDIRRLYAERIVAFRLGGIVAFSGFVGAMFNTKEFLAEEVSFLHEVASCIKE